MQGTRAAEALRDAVCARDFGGLARALAPEADMRALLPGGTREYAGTEAIVAAFERWFRDAPEFVAEARPAEAVGTRVRVGWSARLRRHEDGPPVVVEQTAIVDVDGEVVYGIDLLCTGFEEVSPEAVRGAVHEFDAGDLGCADGLAGEFRRRMIALDAGQVLRVSTRDPAAKEDLPPLARLLGHRVLDVEARPDGRTIISVERGNR